MNTLKYLLLPCLAAAAVATKQYKGAFEVVGTLCYPPDVKGEDKVTITTNSDANKFQRVVMYDDQPESFDQAVAAAGDCGLQLTYAKKVSTKGSKAMVPGWSIGDGGTHTEVITIQQGTKRQWWVAIINCEQSTSTPYPVDVTSISITDSSKYTIDCATMHNYSVAGYNWAIVLMAIAIIVAAVFAVLYWKKSTIGPSGVVNTGGVGYNEL